MRVWLIRHGETEYNKDRRYQGRLDIPLAERGKADLTASARKIARVYVTPLTRTVQTAEILFPGAEQITVPGLAEMDFGKFEGHTHKELLNDPDYQRFLDSGGWTDCPGGEKRGAFSERVCRAFLTLIAECRERGEEQIVIVTHGGTIMALMERFGTPAGEYYEWLPGNGEGYEMEAVLQLSSESDSGQEKENPAICVIRRISFNRKAGRIHLYYGDGRGKSSTAAGTMLRAIHAGFEVTCLQFCKSEGSGETEELKKLGVKLLYGEETGKFVSRMSDEEKHALYERQSQLLRNVLNGYRENKPAGPGMLVLDEVCAAINHQVLDAGILRDLLIRKPSGLEIIMTGRNPAKWLTDTADYVTEYRQERHPYTEGIVARKGIEY